MLSDAAVVQHLYKNREGAVQHLHRPALLQVVVSLGDTLAGQGVAV
jgi:hypothetical protein